MASAPYGQSEIVSPEAEAGEIRNKLLVCITSIYFTCILTLIQLEIDGWNLQTNTLKIMIFILIIPILIFVIVIIRYNTVDSTILQVFIIASGTSIPMSPVRHIHHSLDRPNLHTILDTENTADEVIELNTTLITHSYVENTDLPSTDCPICLEEMFSCEIPGSIVHASTATECIKVCGPRGGQEGNTEPGVNHIFHKDCFKKYLISSYIQQYESIYRNNRASPILPVTGQEIKWLCPICKRDITNSLE
tara:strand:+ start:1316 stop:2062 length:747 start_codon:yes stop_codon:yes gene_type:complete